MNGSLLLDDAALRILRIGLFPVSIGGVAFPDFALQFFVVFFSLTSREIEKVALLIESEVAIVVFG